MEIIDKTEPLVKILADRRFNVDYYQREYRWGHKQISQMISDLTDTFLEFYDPNNHKTTTEVEKYGYYYMGSIICTKNSPHQIVDGQQRLTSLTLFLIYLNNLQVKVKQSLDKEISELQEAGKSSEASILGKNPMRTCVNFMNMIYTDHYGNPSYNIDVKERVACLNALRENKAYKATNETDQNLLDRYHDIENDFPEELGYEALPYFIYWLKEKVLLLEIDTPSEDEAHTIFLTMNDRGLSLNSAEMMKAFIIQKTAETDRENVNNVWRSNISKIKSAADNSSSGIVNAADVEFISVWLRAKYAQSLRDSKKGAIDKDFELLGDKFHAWVRTNSKEVMGLERADEFREFVLNEMSKVTDLYLRLKTYEKKLTPGFEAVYYNASRDLNYQTMLIIAAIRNDDDNDTIDKKIKMVAAFVDDFASIRIFNSKRINWNTNKFFLFNLMLAVRNQSIKEVAMNLLRTLNQMPENITGVYSSENTQLTGRYMLHILARFTSFVNTAMGYPSDFETYMNRKASATYDIEHILPDNFEDYKQFFNDPDDFENYRQKIGNLIILTKDKNRSYQDMKYKDKVDHYLTDNILAKSLNKATYDHNPQFLKLVEKFGFSSFDKFDKEAIRSRNQLYLNLAKEIWNPEIIKNLSGNWTTADDNLVIANIKPRYFTVEYGLGSWEDAVKYGFLSAGIGGSGKTIKNIAKGDMVFCHMKGHGFMGVGICVTTAMPMSNFNVQDSTGTKINIAKLPWTSEEARKRSQEYDDWFIGIKWLQHVDSLSNGYWENGFKVQPTVAYTSTDETTYKKVLEHFGICCNN